MRRAERAASADGQAGQDEGTRGVKDDSRTCGLMHRADEVTATKLRKTTGGGRDDMVKCDDAGKMLGACVKHRKDSIHTNSDV